MLAKPSALHRFFRIAIVGTLASPLTTANVGATPSTISNITLYPGGATIERQIQVQAGSTRLEVSCLPASFDPQSLRLLASPDIQLGDFRIEDAADGEAQSNDRCATTSLDKRIQALQTQLTALNARAQAVELSAVYLKNISEQNADAGNKTSMLAVSRALEQNGYAVYAQRDQIKQQQAQIQRQLDALRGDGDGPVPTQTLRIALDAPRGGLLRIAYDTQRAGWVPAYQANLDSSTGQLTLERRALVAQATGEDWHGVKLQLSTGTPIKNTSSPQPYAWQLRLEEPPSRHHAAAAQPLSVSLQPPAPPMAIRHPDANTPLFTATQVEGTFLTKFEIPGKIDVPSDAQKVGFTLARESLPVRLVARVVPRQSTRAWLIATATRPEGVWPDGNVQLRRDGAQVGETRWSEALLDDELALPFGPDEQVTASQADGPDAAGVVKTLSGDTSKTLSARYTVKNRHRKPIDVEVVESVPISDSADIKVSSNFTPPPDDMSWQGRQGIVAWKRRLAAGEEASVGASFTVRYPGDRTILGLP